MHHLCLGWTGDVKADFLRKDEGTKIYSGTLAGGRVQRCAAEPSYSQHGPSFCHSKNGPDLIKKLQIVDSFHPSIYILFKIYVRHLMEGQNSLEISYGIYGLPFLNHILWSLP